MLVGAKPERPSANYKLNTLVSNRIRKAKSGKTRWSQGSRTLRVGTHVFKIRLLRILQEGQEQL